MLDVANIRWYRALFITLVVALLTTTGITILWSSFAIEPGSLFGFITILSVIFVGYLSLWYMIRRNYQKHTLTITHILNSINDVIVIKDYQGCFIFGNHAVTKLYNSNAEEMVGKDDYYFTRNKEQSDFLRNNVQSIMNSFESEEVFESSTDVNTGEVRHFKSTKIPFYDAGNQRRILVMATDITEIVRLKEEADRDKKRLEHVLDVSEECLWEWNIQTNEVLHNEQWAIMTGIGQSLNTFKEFERCIFDQDKKMVSDALNLLLTQNKQYSIEFRIRRPDGKVIWIWDRGRVAEYDANQDPIWIVGIAMDITTEKENQLTIANLAYTDQLTGLANRSQLDIDLSKMIEESKEKDKFSALLFLDLDRFKLLNDSYGHHMGDHLLKLVAERLQSVCGGDATIARFGGDEFVIILPLLHQSDSEASCITQKCADDIIRNVTNNVHLKCDIQDLEIEYSITGSIGGVIFKSGVLSPGKLLQLADLALYRAKSSGGNLALIFDTSMNDELQQMNELKKAINQAVVSRDFCIFLQPKYDYSGIIIGAESLVRWRDEKLGTMSQDSFIGMAEETNMIIPIGKTVLEQACQQLKRWQASESTAHLKLSVNLSAKQIWQSHFVEEFIAIVESHEIDHTKLIIEVTESVLIQDINDATEKLTKLKEYGISVSLDDFGTGYSSLNYLRSLPIDELKIDRSFIRDVATDEQALLVVKSVIDLANNFGLQVVAEGVEKQEQYELLRAFGVSIYQGFYFSRPLPLDEMDRLLELNLASNANI